MFQRLLSMTMRQVSVKHNLHVGGRAGRGLRVLVYLHHPVPVLPLLGLLQVAQLTRPFTFNQLFHKKEHLSTYTLFGRYVSPQIFVYEKKKNFFFMRKFSIVHVHLLVIICSGETENSIEKQHMSQ